MTPRTTTLVQGAGGSTLIEMLVAVALLSAVSAGIFGGIQRMSRTNDAVANRSSMHAGTRNATELLQQEVGQAGRVAFAPTTLTENITGDPDPIQTKGVVSTSKMYVGQKLYILPGAGCATGACSPEIVTITAILSGPPRISAKFLTDHVIGASVGARGAFSAGIIPPVKLDAGGNTITDPNGSSATVLKLFGDVNDDGNMVYVEYTCDTGAGNLYRKQMAFDAAPPKVAPTVAEVLLNNLLANPDGSACFTYETHKVLTDFYVTDVAITLTVQTPKRDPVTGLFQTETKALLNVAPRNVFEVWQMATMNMTNRVQPTPPTVLALLPN